MTIQVAVLCDAAAEYGGKLSLLGTFDTIFARRFPTQHPNCALALRVLFVRQEEGAHQIDIGFVDDDGRSVLPPIHLPVGVSVGEDGDQVSRNFVVNMQHLKLDRPGNYAFEVSIDRLHLASIPLRVLLAPPAEGGGAGARDEQGG
jgi:hypothetical protein